ncbi:MAG: antirestriction protein ArdA [Clostridia bacterium]
MSNEVNVVIGSWGSYNECNEKALGSSWLDLSLFETWEDIEKELIKQGFDIEGIDEELFIQDIENLPSDACNWDMTSPKKLFETLKESGILDYPYQLEILQAYLEVRNFSDFEELVADKGNSWNEDIYYYKNYDWADFGKEMYDNCYYQVPEQIEQFIDFEAYGRYLGDCYAQEVSTGIIEICA